MQIRTHAVASEAYARVAVRRDDQGKNALTKKEYGTLAHKLPGMILSNGLAQATGFLLAKGNPEHKALLDDLNAVLRASGAADFRDGATLHRHIIESDLRQTLMLTRRALEASGWIKRYVQGVLRVDATGDSDEPRESTEGGG
ncbi:MAG: type III-B CRISPR module-associated protein Cmr5 [Alphaproteobacteria bacterium]|nr:type III-B CRISPR module-associated protein Cmr5 [Alphaproteobacteria bacterium]